ncbi:protein REVERSION-TO-ETHYLENE SENSITIVITY1-like [Triticum dicoccoides]|uniref:protein REVERSION-TO-ETHYLENE SENSITIVITY1-like n=1 Tax=Triticum dicoccoides TaxID=85692 RepID=UPI000E7B4528|nr:protein REVERSION-TO-ETHYLENE SENSITIVITY1-like [Triticum dicoccoides]
MLTEVFSSMEAEADFDVEDSRSNNELQELWPVGEIDPKRGRFPCCIVWTPLPVVSWLAPYIGHVGICQEDGSVLDFAGSNLVSMDNFAYGSVARYLQLDRKKCCFPANLAAHVCEWSYKHTEVGTATSWDGALQLGTRHFQHKYYNLFTCNCYSFVANCLNRLAHGGSAEWNVLNVAALVWLHGEWVDKMSIVRSFAPFVTVTCIGVFMAGWSFLIGISAFCLLLIGWFVFAVYCMKGLVC